MYMYVYIHICAEILTNKPVTGRRQLKCDGTRRTGREAKGKMANGVV